jgi:myosin-1
MRAPEAVDGDVVMRPFLGVKERRRSSFGKVTLGDDLGISNDASCASTLTKYGANEITFSAHCIKINKRDECVKRILVVTNIGVVLLDAHTRRMRRKFAWRDLSEVRVSVFADDFFALVAPVEYDTLLACSRKVEAIVAMRDMWKRDARARGVIGGEDELPVRAGESFTYNATALRVRRVDFHRLADGDVDIDVSDEPNA